MSGFAGLLSQLVNGVTGLRATQYTIVACSALWGYDYLLTFDREVYFVWRSNWSVGKILFFLNRYSPIVDLTLAIYILVGVKDPSICPPLAKATAWSFVAGMIVSEIILAMRTWAVWGGRRSILVFLVLFSMGIYGSAAYLTQPFLVTLQFIQIPAFLQPSLKLTCAPLPAPGKTGLEFMVFMINQTVIAVLTLYRGMQQYKISKNPVLRTMFKDGLLYYVYVFAISVANLAVALALPVQWQVLLEMPLRVISSICCTRVLLNIRAAYFRPGTTTEFEIIQGVTRSTGGWRSSNIASDTTAVPSDMEHGEKGGRGWTWEEAKSPRLSLGRMSPFLYDVPEIPEEVE